METIILRNACTGPSGPTNGLLGTNVLDYFSILYIEQIQECNYIMEYIVHF